MASFDAPPITDARTDRAMPLIQSEALIVASDMVSVSHAVVLLMALPILVGKCGRFIRGIISFSNFGPAPKIAAWFS